MSINHYSSDLSQPQWWSHYMMDSSSANASSQPNFISPTPGYCQLSPNQMFYNRSGAAGFDLNNDDEEDEQPPPMEYSCEEEAGAEIPKEPLFEKPLTPSDVGKLNRLVIPKQHAEKHFPLNGGAAAAEPGENGLLLGFEDENGKSWRFRYSYWNSSQSYVLTKGWSRFVKEKRLDAGDVVVFARHRVDAGRFFIGWRRRGAGAGGGGSAQPAAMANGGGWNRGFYPGKYSYPSQYNQAGPSSSLPYNPESIHAGSVAQQNQTTSSSTTSGNSKRLRLFGVNLECHQADESSEPSTPVGSPMSASQGQAHHPYHHQYYSNSNHMDFSFSGAADVYRQG